MKGHNFHCDSSNEGSQGMFSFRNQQKKYLRIILKSLTYLEHCEDTIMLADRLYHDMDLIYIRIPFTHIKHTYGTFNFLIILFLS